MGAVRNYRKTLAIGAGVTMAAAIVVGVFALSPSGPATAETGSFLRDGKAGFIVTRIAYALGPDASESGACTDGMSKDVSQIFALTPEGQQRPGEDEGVYSKRLEDGGERISASADGKNYCMHPELAPPDTHFRTLDSLSVRADGIDIDGIDSRGRPGTPRHLADFAGKNGAKGVDNQFFRAVGCSRSFQSDGQSNSFEIGMYSGSWGVVLSLDDVDDLENDDDVEVGIYANADPIQLSPTREALEYATYAMDQDENFRATTRGRIRGGVLTTDPVDIRLRSDVNALTLERPLRDARIQATLSKDGVLKGYLAGYAPVEQLYDYQFAFRNAKDVSGKPAPLGRIIHSSNGAARVLGYTCQGVYQALHRLADAHPDPRTGKFTAISTQYAFEARPAFVVDVDTKSVNEKLVRND
ncbi:hypothetical protein GCM10011494_02110 [Novosphingobium endophyticum]|uniref:Uncharacterized protein n=1 Tax=Novosphingobium endophyticum TaxID=1955250 RepID=A0A916TNN7_9SPHN|nr:hypothetical protein [Novosphingobium endophyticum]GGB87343.1 hypothetical protein GCM10011494_02110 [Novosphingobium endophyticum]